VIGQELIELVGICRGLADREIGPRCTCCSKGGGEWWGWGGVEGTVALLLNVSVQPTICTRDFIDHGTRGPEGHLEVIYEERVEVR
jgi:hypothetical protein